VVLSPLAEKDSDIDTVQIDHNETTMALDHFVYSQYFHLH